MAKKEHELTERDRTGDKILDTLKEETSQLLDEIADFIFSESQKNIIKNNSFGVTGNLYGKVTIDKTQKLAKYIEYEVPYAEEVEYGTDAHHVPPEVLHEWCELKFGLTPKDARRVAYLVARKIEHEGIEEKPFLRPAMRKAEKKYRDKLG